MTDNALLITVLVGVVSGLLAYYLPLGKIFFLTAKKILKSGDGILDLFDKRHGHLEIEIHYKRKGQLMRLDRWKSTHRKARRLCRWSDRNFEAQF